MTRLQSVTEKIDRTTTGLAGAIFVHIDHMDGRVHGVRISTKWKDGQSFDNVATALGDTLTSMLTDLQANCAERDRK